MKKILSLLLVVSSTLAYAKVMNVNVINTVEDDEGLKIIASEKRKNTEDAKVFYIDNRSANFAQVKEKVKAGDKIKIKTNDDGHDAVVEIGK